MVSRFLLPVTFVFAVALQGLGQELFWNDVAGIHRVRDGDPHAVLLFQTFETRGIVVDQVNDRLLWSDTLPLGGPLPGGVIRSASVDGGEVADVVRHLPAPAGIALEPHSGKIYWTDLGDGVQPSAVFSANLDGTDVQKLISLEWLSEIEGIAIDSQRKHVYFTYVNPLLDGLFNGGIARANLDGSGVETIISGLSKPIGIAVDSQSQTIFWAHAKMLGDGPAGAIEAVDLDGQRPRTILDGLQMPYGIALDSDARNIYWTDSASGKIQRTSMGGILPFFEDVVSGLGSPTAIVHVPEPAVGIFRSISTLLVVWATWSQTFRCRSGNWHDGNATI